MHIATIEVMKHMKDFSSFQGNKKVIYLSENIIKDLQFWRSKRFSDKTHANNWFRRHSGVKITGNIKS